MLNPPKKLSTCPNCQTSLENLETFCPNCGQKNEDIILPLRAHLSDLFESIFNWDSRLIRSTKTLFFAPGKITIDFNEGKRKTYVPPLRLYLIASIVFFLLLSLVAKDEIKNIDSSLKENIGSIKDTMHLNLGTTGLKMTGEQVLEIEKLNDEQLDSLLVANDINPSFYNRLSIRQSIRAMTGDISEFYAQFTNIASIGMFFLMPVFAGLLMLFFRKPKRFYVEHLILSVHLHTLFFLAFILNIFFQMTPVGGVFSFLLPFLLIGYVLLNLKRVYDKPWKKTIGNSLLLFLSYLIVFLGFFTVVILLSLLMF